ncbi:histidine kinase N-terminal 7TM domain-containing protein [Paenibacillus pinistramenti]|uniref:histidine kinase N-terminal 7TM domain-containing diguanylate cyclase n=1 Tax=Paenibacillus pinistramenti TaxID=1768003 RepID=UPI0011097919|nr:histidine kinase N-terminal 7TM domain-containing protein [Paenibacillus pinistramenti]
MGSLNTDYIVIISFSGVLHVFLAFLAYFRRADFQGAKAFVAIAVTSAIYIFGYALELSSGTLNEIRFWTKAEYLGLPFISPADLVLVLYFVGLDKLVNRITLPLLFAVPAVSCVMALTNDAHHLLYREIYLRPDTPFLTADIVMGPWYIVHGSYTFGCLFAGACIIIAKWNSMKHNYKWQMLTILIGILLPSAASLAYLLGLSPYGMDPVPVVMSITSTLYILAIWSRGMLSAAPIARENLFANLVDGVLVTDLSGRVIDYNPSAERMIPELDASIIGKPLLLLMEQASPEAASFVRNSVPDIKSETRAKWLRSGQTLHYLLRSTPVLKRGGGCVGRMIKLTDVTEQTVLQEKLRFMATRDSLTGVYNRGYWLEQSREALARCRQLERPLSLILLDADHFKSINDSYGHDIGDLALRHMTGIGSGHLQDDCPFGRYGGEEFVICLPGMPLEEAGQLAEAIREEIAASPLMTAKGPVSFTSSFGVADDRSGSTLEEILSAADEALYRSKHSGRNQVHLTRRRTAASAP